MHDDLTKEPAKTPTSREASLRDFLPAQWQTKDGQAFVSAYRMLGVPLADVAPAFAVELGDVCVVMGWFQLPHLRMERELEATLDGTIQISLRGGGEGENTQTHPSVPAALFFAPGTRDEQIDARERIQDAVALLSAIESMLLVFEHIEDYWFTFADGQLSGAAALIVDPLWFQEARVDEDARCRWRLGVDALIASPDSASIRLSLRWFDEAKRVRGIDAFLGFWFALETLVMPNTTDIRPIRDGLATVYGIAAADVETRFGVGRLFGLRSRIVHDGLRIDIPGLLLSVVAGIYVDLLVQRLGFASAKRAQRALDEAGGLSKVLPRVVGGDAD